MGVLEVDKKLFKLRCQNGHQIEAGRKDAKELLGLDFDDFRDFEMKYRPGEFAEPVVDTEKCAICAH